MKMVVLYLLVASAAICGYADEEAIREALFASTNYWGRDAEAYKAQIATAIRQGKRRQAYCLMGWLK